MPGRRAEGLLHGRSRVRGGADDVFAGLLRHARACQATVGALVQYPEITKTRFFRRSGALGEAAGLGGEGHAVVKSAVCGTPQVVGVDRKPAIFQNNVAAGAGDPEGRPFMRRAGCHGLQLQET